MNQEFAQASKRFSQYIKRRYPKTTTAVHYQSDLTQFCQVIDKVPKAVTRADISQFVTAQLKAERSPATINRRLATLRSFFNFLADEAEDDYWINPVLWHHHAVKMGHHLPRDLPEKVARTFWAAIQDGPIRDQALVALMLDVGLRVGEVMRICVDDFEAATPATGMAGLRVQGKGNKERRVWLMAETAVLVEKWLAERPSVADNAMFITRRQRGFTIRGLQDRVKHYTQRAGLPLDQVSCHRLRHTSARRLAEAGMPLPSLSHWLGHSKLETTQMYTDGISPTILADYQQAMKNIVEIAECTPESAEMPKTLFVTAPDEPVGAAPELTRGELKAIVHKLPAWLQSWVVDFAMDKQARFLKYHRRSRTTGWCNQVCRIWEWMLQQREIGDFTALRRLDLVNYLNHIRQLGRKPITLNQYRYIFLKFLRYVDERKPGCIAPGLYRVELAKVPDRLPKPLSLAECRRLEKTLHHLTTTKRSARDAALDRSWFFVLLDGGLRISELLTLTVGDWDSERQLITIRYGKGNKQRQILITQRATQALQAHLEQRVNHRTDEALLMLRGKPVTPATLRLRLKVYAREAGVEDVHPHRLRHTFATRLLNTGKMPILSLQKLMGHAKLDDTMRYVALSDQRVREDYQRAMAPLRAQDELDWDLWNPAIEEALRRDAEKLSDNQPIAASSQHVSTL